MPRRFGRLLRLEWRFFDICFEAFEDRAFTVRPPFDASVTTVTWFGTTANLVSGRSEFHDFVRIQFHQEPPDSQLYL